jgi:hypothetical protein
VAAAPAAPAASAPRGRAGGLGTPAVTPRPLPAYRDMFLLTNDELLAGPILDCPGGASPFGAQVRALGGQVTSVDPAYRSPTSVLLARVRSDVDRIAAWQQAHPTGFDWSYLGSPQAVAQRWRAALGAFAADFVVDGDRYVAAALPTLPFPDRRFALTVSGFLLFSYPEMLDFDDHVAALLELCRVTSDEVRVYPVHDTGGRPYARLSQLRAVLRRRGVHTALRSTGCSYSPQPGNDRMLVLVRKEHQTS